MLVELALVHDSLRTSAMPRTIRGYPRPCHQVTLDVLCRPAAEVRVGSVDKILHKTMKATATSPL
jgi:hypothetical protein